MSGELEDVPLVLALPSEARLNLIGACEKAWGKHNWWLSLEDDGRAWLRCMRCPATLDDIAPGTHEAINLYHAGVRIQRGWHDAPAARFGEAWPVTFQVRQSNPIRSDGGFFTVGEPTATVDVSIIEKP